MRVVSVVLVAAIVAVALVASPAAARQESGAFIASEVSIRGGVDEPVVFSERRYGGTLSVVGRSTGMTLTETVTVGDYLSGIQEVPFGWEPEALRAQAIAARTYLAWTLNRGRTEEGSRLGYDICATDACQVYAGLEPRNADDGDKWLAAVNATRDEILLYADEPALTYYSSTSGGRTRTVGDVFTSVDLPYLNAVDSPNEDSPFASWEWWLGASDMEALLSAAGLVDGDLIGVTTEVTQDGDGPWMVRVESTGGRSDVTTWDLRGSLNRAGPEVLPDLLPTTRVDGRRFPQTVLSPSFTIESRVIAVPTVIGMPAAVTVYRVAGNGWGHLVGMSQYGAQAMAEAGSEAPDILAHFYSGLRPEVSEEFVPDDVEVALVTDGSVITLDVPAGATIEVDGQPMEAEETGTWTFRSTGDAMAVIPPFGRDRLPDIDPGAPGFDGPQPVLRPVLNTSAILRWSIRVDGVDVASFGPEQVGPGVFEIPIPTAGQKMEVTIRASNGRGGDAVFFSWDR